MSRTPAFSSSHAFPRAPTTLAAPSTSVADLFSEDLESLSPAEQAELAAAAVGPASSSSPVSLPSGRSRPTHSTRWPRRHEPKASTRPWSRSCRATPISTPGTWRSRTSDSPSVWRRPQPESRRAGPDGLRRSGLRPGTFLRGTEVPVDEGSFMAERGAEYQLVPVFAEDAIETYVHDSGRVRDRTEEPSSLGTRRRPAGIQFHPIHRPLDRAGRRLRGRGRGSRGDRRGGMGWASLRVTVP